MAYQVEDTVWKSGMTFGDLSPNNILIDADQEPNTLLVSKLRISFGRIDAFQGGTPSYSSQSDENSTSTGVYSFLINFHLPLYYSMHRQK